VKSKLATLGVDPTLMSPTEFDAFIVRQIAADAALARTAGVKPQ
jgi:tripartite-type tricarboxylate transporter receptor subunit TctC